MPLIFGSDVWVHELLIFKELFFGLIPLLEISDEGRKMGEGGGLLPGAEFYSKALPFDEVVDFTFEGFLI